MNKVTSTTINVIPKIDGISSSSIKPVSTHMGSLQVPKSYSFGNHTMIYNIEKSGDKHIYEFEFSTCMGEMDVIIAETSDFYNKDFRDQIVFQRSISMKNIIARIDSHKNLYIYLNGIRGEPKKLCKQDVAVSNCNLEDKWVDYSISYAILVADEVEEVNIEDEGLIKINDSGIGNSLIILWKPVRYFNKSKFLYEANLNIKYYIYAVDNELSYSKLQSTCFLVSIKPSFIIPSDSNSNLKEYTKIANKSYKETIYINILAQNVNTGESYTYVPTKLFISYSSNLLFVLMSLIVTIIVLGFAFYFYRKFRQARQALSYEIRNHSFGSKLHEEGSGSSAKNSSDEANAKKYANEIALEQAKNTEYLDLESHS